MNSGGQPTSDRSVIAKSAYADDRYLQSRQRLYDFQTPTYDLPGIVLERLSDADPTVVLDVGCGNGRYTSRFRGQFPRAAVIAIDIAPGILGAVGSPAVVADAAHLPFAAASAEVVLAMHMLYHVEDVEAGVRELARVLDPSGTAFVSTNAIEDKSELDDLWRRAASHVLGTPDPPERISLSRRFSLNAAPEMLGRYFGSVQVHELPGTIRVTSTGPVINHLASYESFANKTGIPFHDTVKAAESLLREHLDEYGEFTITCLGGILECKIPATSGNH
ncbi:class I SAM-dependent methyltransferase [Promicromonospora sp. MS192]|uniref:class I SAM-dependent methyltransferase n=1 Tax=Promicromonospora sp. MS192 TaxID=3412684 RepID=UPI003C2E7584